MVTSNRHRPGALTLGLSVLALALAAALLAAPALAARTADLDHGRRRTTRA
jgi:hypothetical protein